MQMRAIHKKKGNMAAAAAAPGPAGAAAAPPGPAPPGPLSAAGGSAQAPRPAGLRSPRGPARAAPRGRERRVRGEHGKVRRLCSEGGSEMGNPSFLPEEPRPHPACQLGGSPAAHRYLQIQWAPRSLPTAMAAAVTASFIKSDRANTDIANRNATARRPQQSTLNFPITRKVSKYFIFLFQCHKELGCFLTNIYRLRPKCISKTDNIQGNTAAHTQNLLWISSKPVTAKILRDP